MANLYTIWTHPHNTTNVKDESATNAVQSITLPLHRPHFCIFAAKGEANKIDWYTGTEARNEFGAATFERNTPYWNNEQTFLVNAVLPNQGCFITRLVPEDATASSVVLELHIKKNVLIQQYKRALDGSYILDAEDNKIKLQNADGSDLVEPGVIYKWTTRALTEDEEFDTVKPSIMEVGDEVTYIYPIVAAKYRSAGAWGNRAGFKFFCNRQDQEAELVTTHNALLYTFAPAEKPYSSDTPTYLGTIYESAYSQFILTGKTYDDDTKKYVDANSTIFRLYTEDSSTKSILPFDVHFYTENVKEVSDAILEFENGVDELIGNPYMVNVCSFTDVLGNEYPHVMDEVVYQMNNSNNGFTSVVDCVYLTDKSYHYLSGGSDGDISREKFEELYRAFLDFKIIPELQDYMHYPITHLYDTGYSNDTKVAQFDFAANMPNVVITSATQDASKDMYDLDTAISVGTYLRTQAMLTPESELYGTQACRAQLFIQSGHLNDKNYTELVPYSFWLCERRCTFQNATFIKGDLGPDPNNRVTLFRDVNFIPYSKTQKELCFKNALNYCEHGRMDRHFFASVQSVYKNKTSMLADVWFVDAVIYLKYIIDWAWADTANASMPLPALSQLVTTKIRDAAVTAFGSKYTLTECEFYQTEEEALLGTTYHVRCVLVGDSPNLIWNSDIIVRRSNLNADGTANV